MTDELELEYVVSVKSDGETGDPIHELWKLNNASRDIHRVGGPAISSWDRATGGLVLQSFYLYGRPHNDHDAAHIRFDPKSGERISEEWRDHGLLHREGDEPALWTMDPDTGVIFWEKYCQNGQLHRENGPAQIWRDRQTGQITGVEYYREGEKFEPPGITCTLDPGMP